MLRFSKALLKWHPRPGETAMTTWLRWMLWVAWLASGRLALARGRPRRRQALATGAAEPSYCSSGAGHASRQAPHGPALRRDGQAADRAALKPARPRPVQMLCGSTSISQRITPLPSGALAQRVQHRLPGRQQALQRGARGALDQHLRPLHVRHALDRHAAPADSGSRARAPSSASAAALAALQEGLRRLLRAGIGAQQRLEGEGRHAGGARAPPAAAAAKAG